MNNSALNVLKQGGGQPLFDLSGETGHAFKTGIQGGPEATKNGKYGEPRLRKPNRRAVLKISWTPSGSQSSQHETNPFWRSYVWGSVPVLLNKREEDESFK